VSFCCCLSTILDALVDALRGSLVRLTTTTFPFEILATPLAFSQHFAAAANLKKVCDST
jgi:hypothetical protein